MAIVVIPSVVDVQTLSERRVGHALKTIFYPQMIDCICVTGRSPIGLFGAHVTPGMDEGEFMDLFKIFNVGGGKSCIAWYMVGCFTKHFSRNKVELWNSRKKMAAAMRTNVNKNAVIYTCDTSPLYNEPYGGGFEIAASPSKTGVDFEYRVSKMVNPPPFKKLPYGFLRA